MKGIFQAACACAAIALTSSARADDFRVGMVVSGYGMSATEAAAAILIADALDMNVGFVISSGRPFGGSFLTYGPAFVLAYETGRPFGDVWRLRKQGHGWGVVAQRLGMHPGTFNKLRRNGDWDRYAWVHMCGREYRWSDDDFRRFEGYGVGRGDVICAAVYADGNKTKAKAQVDKFKKSKTWSVPKGKKPASSAKKSVSSDKGKASTGNAKTTGKPADKGNQKPKETGKGKPDHGGHGKGKGTGG